MILYFQVLLIALGIVGGILVLEESKYKNEIGTFLLFVVCVLVGILMFLTL